MNFLNGLNRFLEFISNNWTAIMVTIGLIIGLVKKVKSYVVKSNEEKVEIAKSYIRESILKLITDAEMDFEEWNKAGSIKRSQVIARVYAEYPILKKIANQEEIIQWIDKEIDNSLNTLREIIAGNKTESADAA